MKIICIGRNYPQHAEELGNEKPESPVVFLKPDTAIIQKSFPFYIPPFSDQIHHEVEVVVKINRIGKYIEEKFAHKYYQEIGLGIDFTARDLQKKLKEKGLPWEKAKAFDGSALMGSWFDKSQFKDFIKKLQDEGLTITSSSQQDNPDELELFKLVNIKHLIGKLMWYILAGTVITSISYNYIINIKCTQSLKDVEKLIEESQNNQ